MKKLFVCLIIFTISATAVNAQFVRGWGLKAGATFSKQEWDYSSSPGDPEKYNRTGLNVGVFVELLNNPLFTIVTEANYVQKGAESNVTVPLPGPDAEITSDKRIDYINFAALGKVRINLGIIRPYVLAGPKIDFEIEKTNSEPFQDNFQKGRWGFKVGVGSKVNILPINLFAEILYDADFNDLYGNQNLNINTSSVDLRVGILF